MKKDNIEEIYSGLGEFSKEPPKELWDKIEDRLHPKKKRRGVLWFWGSVAAVLVLLIGYVITDSPDYNKPIKEITDIKQSNDDGAINNSNDAQTTKIVKGTGVNNNNEDALDEELNITNGLLNNVSSKKQLSERNKILEKTEKRKTIVENTNKKNRNEKKETSKYNNSYSQNSIKEKNDNVNNKDMAVLQKKDKKTVDYEKTRLATNNDSISKSKDVSLLDISKELVAKNEKTKDSTDAKDINSKWSVEVIAGLSNTNASESSIQNASVNTASQNDFVYALKFGYSLSDRLVVKSGIGKNILGQEINNVKYISSGSSLSADNSQNIISNQAILFLASQEAINDFSTTNETINEGNLQQQLDYIQVPLEFSYKLLEGQKYDVSLGLGGNINFLTNNQVFLDNEDIGENRGVDATIFGATLNSNISYEVAKKMTLFLEPSYNYFQKPIDNRNQSFNNTQLRVLFGVRYKL